MAFIKASEIGSIAEEEANSVGVPANLFRRVVLSGENYDKPEIDTSLVSPKGARGPAQVIESTWQGLIKNGSLPADADINDVRTNLRAGALVLKEQLDRSGGNHAAAVAGYNAGNLVNDTVAAGGQPPAKATQEYLKRLSLSPQTPELMDTDTTPTVAPTVTPGNGLPLARVTTKGGDPAADNASLAAMQAQNKAASVMFQNALFSGAADLRASANAELDAGNAAGDVATIQGGIDVAKMLQTQLVNTTLHASVSDPDSAIVDAQSKRQAAKIKMDALRPVIEAEDKVAVWDDPLRWIANQFTLPNLKKEYNNSYRDMVTQTAYMADTQRLADAQQKIDPALVVDETMRLATAKALAFKAKAIADFGKLSATSQEYTAKAIQQDIILNDRNFDQTMALSRMHQESFSYARATAASAKQDAKEQRMQGTVDAISMKLNSIGMPTIDLNGLEMLGSKKASALTEWAQYGPIGKGPGDAMANIREFGNDQAVAEKNPILFRFINGMIASKEYTDLAAEKQSDPKFQHLAGQEQREALMQELYARQRQQLDKTKTNPNPANSELPNSNPYKLVHLNVPAMPELKDNPFIVDVPIIAAASVDKSTVTDKDMLLAYMGKVTAEPGKVKEHAAELADYYNKATQTQWLKGGAAITGYPKFQEYRIADPSGGKPINAMSALELESWATRYLAHKNAQTGQASWGSAGGFGFR